MPEWYSVIQACKHFGCTPEAAMEMPQAYLDMVADYNVIEMAVQGPRLL